VDLLEHTAIVSRPKTVRCQVRRLEPEPIHTRETRNLTGIIQQLAAFNVKESR
jgi:hypothetical protein